MALRYGEVLFLCKQIVWRCRVSKQEEKRDKQIEKFREVDAWTALRRQQGPKGTANH